MTTQQFVTNGKTLEDTLSRVQDKSSWTLYDHCINNKALAAKYENEFKRIAAFAKYPYSMTFYCKYPEKEIKPIPRSTSVIKINQMSLSSQDVAYYPSKILNKRYHHICIGMINALTANHEPYLNLFINT